MVVLHFFQNAFHEENLSKLETDRNLELYGACGKVLCCKYSARLEQIWPYALAHYPGAKCRPTLSLCDQLVLTTWA